MNCRTSCSKTILAVFVLLAIAAMATSAFGQAPPPLRNCIQNEFNISQGASSTSTAANTRLNCTADDVKVAQVVNVRDPITGDPLVNCQSNQPFSFIADFKIVTSSKSTRSNIGLYIAERGTTTADALSVNNTCADNLIPPPASLTNGTARPVIGNTTAQFPCNNSSGIQCGTNYYDEFDPSPDSCGDTSSADNGGAKAQQIITLQVNGFNCPDPSTSNLPTCTVNGVTGPCAVLPNCTSWQVPGQTIQCTAPSGQQSWNISAVPGDKAKCNCETILLPVLVQTPSITVNKYCATQNTSGLNVACDSGVEGSDEVTYTVKVTNTSNTGQITFNQVCDNRYGGVLDSTHGTGGVGTCPAGSIGSVTGSSCAATTVNASSSDSSCTFTAKTTGDPSEATVTNKVTVSGTSQFAGAFSPTDSNEVTVTPTEAPSSATVTKGLGNPNLTAGCATARFSVDVHNTSSTQFDETETLTALSDSAYGNITICAGSSNGCTGGTNTAILGTTCGVASGEGTLSGTAGAGALPKDLAPDAHYTCAFDAQFCGTLGAVEEFGTGTCNPSTYLCSAGKPSNTSCSANSDCDLTCTGLSHTNHVTATMHGDEGANDTVSPSTNELNTSVCLSPFTLSN